MLLEGTEHDGLVRPVEPVRRHLEARADAAAGEQEQVAEGAGAAVVVYSRSNPKGGSLIGGKVQAAPLIVPQPKRFGVHERRLSVLFQFGQRKGARVTRSSPHWGGF